MSLNLKSVSSFPSSAVNDSSSGDVQWASPSRVTAQDQSYTTATLNASDTASYILKTTGYSFDLPCKALIVGVKALIVAKSQDTDESFQLVKLIRGDTLQGTDRAHDSFIGFADSEFAFGGERDTWGLSLTADEVGSSSFGVAFQVVTSSGGSGPKVSVDAVRLQIFYAHSLKSAIYALLKGAGLITTIVGSAIYLGHAPSSAPGNYIIYQVIDDVPTHHQGGSSGLARARVQIDCYADDVDQLESLATAVRMSLDGYRGRDDSADTFLNLMTLDNSIDGLEEPKDASQKRKPRTMLDFMVWHEESKSLATV